jgi:hypothetical protein
MPVILAVAGGIAVGKGVQSAIRANRAKKEIKKLQEGLREPKYELPQELMDVYNRQLGQRTDMPGMSAAQSGLDLSYGTALGGASRAATSSQDLLSVATGLGGQKMAAGLDLATQAGLFKAQAEQQKIQNLQQTGREIAGYRDTMYQENQLNPFLRTSAAISALREKRYQESNNTFDAFAKAAQVGGQFGSAAGGYSNIGDYSTPSLT